jgi:hypothetical protein
MPTCAGRPAVRAAKRLEYANASTDTKKARFTANSLGQCPVQSVAPPTAGLDWFVILQCTIAVLAFPQIAPMYFDRFALHRTHSAGGYS